MKKFYVVLLLTLCSTELFFSQTYLGDGLTSYSCTISATNGTYSFRSAFAIDNNGHKWIGFSSGYTYPFQLVRFDGTAWYSMPHVPSHKVNALEVDALNNLWIGTDSGLVKYDGSSYTIYNTGNSAIISNTVNCIEAAGGNVYVGTAGGLSVLNGTVFTNYTRALNGLRSDSIYALKYENAGAVWIGNVGGLEKFNGTSFTYDSLGAVGESRVHCIYIDPQGNKWIGTDNYGVVKYNNSTFSTMYQLFGQYAITGCTWPTRTFSICKGPNGGVAFNVMPLNWASLAEINGNDVKVYRGIGYYNTALNPNGHSKYEYDASSNKFFYINTRGGFPAPSVFLFEFDHMQFAEDPTITSSNSEYLDINNVAALITANADMGWDGANTKYFVPKDQGTGTLFNSALWMGGWHNGSLKMAAMTYRQIGMDYGPGPLDTLTGTCDSLTSLQYNRVWKVNRFDIANFIYNWNAGNVQNGTFLPAASILSWPAHGTGNYSRNLAPFVDVNGNGTYDPLTGGDYPLIKGDQMIWRIFNDSKTHTETGGANFGAEVHASAYAYVCPGIADSNGVLNYTTFYHYKIINRSANQYDSCYLGTLSNTDLGQYIDDYIGCDVMNNFGFTLNGDAWDEDGPVASGYHGFLPIFACNILNGPAAEPGDGFDNNNDGVIDEPSERNLLNGFTYYANTNDPLIGNPSGNMPMQYCNLLRSRWRNGMPMTYGGTGTSSTGVACRHLFPGNTDPYGISLGGSGSNPIPPPGSFGTTGWTQEQAGIFKNDMRLITTSGPFTMLPGSTHEYEFAYVFSQDSANCYNDTAWCTFQRAQQDNIRVRNWFNNNSFPSCLSLTGVSIEDHGMPAGDVTLYPNPASTQVFVEFVRPQPKATIEIFDVTGRMHKGATFHDVQKYLAIPIEELPPGLYTLRIKAEGGSVVKKFVKP